MNDKKLKIAVTGNIGSGKSTFCNFFESKGYKVLRADDIAKDILKLPKVINPIYIHFPKKLYNYP